VTAATDEVVLLWRPGCGFCLALQHGLDRAGLDYTKRNIWQDADAAALVRRFAGGAETVPTVLVGEIGLVNPTSGRVLRTVHEVAPDRLPDGYEPPEPGRLARFLTRLLGGR
jgi:glutaredoxin